MYASDEERDFDVDGNLYKSQTHRSIQNGNSNY